MKLFEIFEKRPTGYTQFSIEDSVEVLTDKLYGIDKTSVLDTFVKSDNHNFYAYITRSVDNEFKDRLEKSKKEIPSSDKMESGNDFCYNNVLRDKANVFLVSLLDAEFKKHLPKKQNNPNRLLYIGLFFTEQFTDFCKILYPVEDDDSLRAEFMNRETLIFKKINDDFLDHVMEELCRRIGEVCDSEYKQNKCFGIKQSPEQRIAPIFDAKVFITFMEKEFGRSVTSAAISQQRGYYRDMIKRICT